MTNATVLGGDWYVVSRSGKPVIRQRMTLRNKLRWAAVVFLPGILITLSLLAWPHAKSWFDQRWQPVYQYKEVQDIPPPLSSELNQHLTQWIQRNAKRPVRTEFAQMIVREVFKNSNIQHVDPFLVLAVMRIESQFDYTAYSDAGAVGLMQVIPKWHLDKMTNVQHVYDPKQNIRVGTQILAEYKDAQQGNIRKALLQYNGSLHLPGSQYHKKVMAARTELVGWLEQQLTTTVNTQ